MRRSLAAALFRQEDDSMNTFLYSITNLFLNILGFFVLEPIVVLFAICLVIYTFGMIRWLL